MSETHFQKGWVFLSGWFLVKERLNRTIGHASNRHPPILLGVVCRVKNARQCGRTPMKCHLLLCVPVDATLQKHTQLALAALANSSEPVK